MRARVWFAAALATAGVALGLAAVSAASSNPVVAALRKTSVARSSVGRLAAVTTTSDGGKITMAGTLQSRGDNAHIAVTVSSGTVHYPMEVTVVVEQGDLVLYMRSPILTSSLPPGKTWVRIDLQRESEKLGVDLSSLLGMAGKQSSLIADYGIVKTTPLGRASVAGRPTSHYRILVDYDLAARRNAVLAPAIRKIERLAGLQSLKVKQDVWVGSDGRVRMLHSTQPGLSNGVRTTTSQTFTFLAYDVPVKISAPPSSLVYSP